MKKIIVIILCCVVLNLNVNVNAEELNGDWENALRRLLMQFPSLFDRIYVEECYDKNIIPSDALDLDGQNYVPREFGWFGDGNCPSVYVLYAVMETDLETVIKFSYDENIGEYLQSMSGDGEKFGSDEKFKEVVNYVQNIYDNGFKFVKIEDMPVPDTRDNFICVILVLLLCFAIIKKIYKKTIYKS